MHVWSRLTVHDHVRPGYDVKLHPVTKAQFSTIEVVVAMPMTSGSNAIEVGV